VGEKTEDPTDKKLEDARKKGQVPVSKDLGKLCVMTAIAEIAFATEPLWRQGIETLLLTPSMRIGQDFRFAMLDMAWSATLLLLIAFAVVWLACSLVATAAFWGQFGVLIAPEAVAPDFNKINPGNGLKQLFSPKKIVDLLESLCKAVLIGLIVYLLVRSELPDIVRLSGGAPKDVYFGFVALLRGIFHMVIGVCLVLAFVDFAIQKYFHKKGLRMDMEEIKREFKENEGDPMLKGKRKQLAMQWLSEGPATATQGANAVVVNPTHFAVAMFYDAAEPMVPVVLAKGRDETAQAMIAVARERGIPVIRHVWLARTLYATCRASDPVPRASYEAVAYVYAVVHELVVNRETGRLVELETRGENDAG
jgi:type III secretion protein U